MRDRHSKEDLGGIGRTARAEGLVPGKRTLTEQVPAHGHADAGVIARKSSGSPAATASSPAASFEQATNGGARELPHRSTLERAFGTTFGDVQAHVGGEHAEAGLGALGAVAAAHGNRVAFRDNPSLELAAHETAHIVQQRGGGGVQRKPLHVSAPSDDAESRADAAAAAVVLGLPVPDVGTAPGDGIHRAVETSGGKWATPKYETLPAGTGVSGDRVAPGSSCISRPTSSSRLLPMASASRKA